MMMIGCGFDVAASDQELDHRRRGDRGAKFAADDGGGRFVPAEIEPARVDEIAPVQAARRHAEEEVHILTELRPAFEAEIIFERHSVLGEREETDAHSHGSRG